jgi:XTP/dITP diphosphohydrolase
MSTKRSTLVLATRNPGKIAELGALLGALPLEVRSLRDFPQVAELPEESDTYVGNAVSKAVAAARATGYPALADDSGLEVDALGGAPGVHSARFLGPTATDVQRNAEILARLRDVPPERRTARFRAVVAVATLDGTVRAFEGVVEGRIAEAPAGAGGFGYDPIFLVPEYGRTMAELPPGVKNRISHRARAVRGAIPLLLDLAREAMGVRLEPEHVAAVRAVEEQLRAAFGRGWDVRVQVSLSAGSRSQPEPDVAVVPGHVRDDRPRHPERAVLVVEVAHATLAFDRERKGPVYAATGIPEYWIVNLAEGMLEVYRDPGPDPQGRTRYRSEARLGPSAAVTPLARPDAVIRVADLLAGTWPSEPAEPA